MTNKLGVKLFQPTYSITVFGSSFQIGTANSRLSWTVVRLVTDRFARLQAHDEQAGSETFSTNIFNHGIRLLFSDRNSEFPTVLDSSEARHRSLRPVAGT